MVYRWHLHRPDLLPDAGLLPCIPLPRPVHNTHIFRHKSISQSRWGSLMVRLALYAKYPTEKPWTCMLPR